MSPNSDFHIFRDTRRRVPLTALVDALRTKLLRLPFLLTRDDIAYLLLQAGELECGLQDAQDAALTWQAASRITDACARAAVERGDAGVEKSRVAATILPLLDRMQYPGEVNVSVPEGFAYYALHPLDYADLVSRLKISDRAALVVGIRSIGVTLSAVVAAELSLAGVSAERFTVRPSGHPYNRQCEFDARQRQFIAAAVAADAECLICDEGPGRSGSSLLSVAEALEREGIPHARISILCSHEPDVSSLCAPDAARRWGRYRVAAAGLTRRLPGDTKEYLGGGEWRRAYISAGRPWPALWPQMERLKYAGDNGALLTFEGHGEYGAAVQSRNEAMAGAGFGPAYLGQELGFGRHVIENSIGLQRDDLGPALLSHMAGYCAWRASTFAVTWADTRQLETMTRVNFEREFGVELRPPCLRAERPTICDSRMMPYEWIRSESGRWLKLDAAIHGDDHFFPGPCDIAWDVAGIVVEWELSASAREFLLDRYELLTADPISQRIHDYELAYAIFRLSWSKMAAHSVGDGEEAERLFGEYERYRRWVESHMSEASTRSIAPTSEQVERNTYSSPTPG